MVAIRPVSGAADIATAATLFREYAASLNVSLCFQDFDREVAELPGAYSPPEGGLWLAELKGVPIGCIALRPLGGNLERIGEVKRLYVRPAGRGSGAGRALVETLLAAARRIGYRRLRLDTLSTMQAAQRLYESFGFRDGPAYCFNPQPDVRYMELTLT